MKRVIILLSFCFISTYYIIAQTQIERIRKQLFSYNTNSVIVVAHRGDWRNFPENSLEGNVKDETNILGYKVNSLILKIKLENSKVATIELSYVDVETNLTVKVIVKYSY